VEGVPMPEAKDETLAQVMAAAGQTLPSAVHEAAPGAR
jgi:aerobic C4-dicarboxylate transport protein